MQARIQHKKVNKRTGNKYVMTYAIQQEIGLQLRQRGILVPCFPEPALEEVCTCMVLSVV